MDFNQYFYFIGITFFLPIWIYLFLRTDKRRDMLFIGLILGLGVVLLEHTYALLDYWTPIYIFPNLHFEDFYYGFVFGGISAELTELVLKSRNSIKRMYPTRLRLVLIFAFITLFSFYLLVDILKLPSTMAYILPAIIIGCITAILRKDLFVYSLVNGILITVLTFLMYRFLLYIYPDIFINHWMIDNLSNIYILDIPLEEYLFAFGVGFAGSNTYELLFGYGIVKEKRKKK